MTTRVLLTGVMVLMMNPLFSQPGNPESDPDDAVPISGIEILLLTGGLLGIRKITQSIKDVGKKDK